MGAQDPDEIFDVVDERDRVVGRERRCVVHEKHLRHRAVHLLVLNPSRDAILLQKRSMAKDSCPGLLSSACAGHVDAGEDYESAVLRELQEELGLTLDPEEIFKIGRQEPSETNGFEFVNIYLCYIPQGRHFAYNREEIDALCWMEVADFFEALDKSPEKFAPSFVSLVRKVFVGEPVPVREDFENQKCALTIERLGGNGVLTIPVVGSKKCRRLTLKYDKGRMLVLVNERLKVTEDLLKKIELFVIGNRPWIERQLGKARERQFVLKSAGTLRDHLRDNPQIDLPLDACEYKKSLEIVPVPLKAFYLLDKNDEKVIVGVRENHEEEDLRAQLRLVAGRVLPEQVRLLAARCGVSVGDINIKDMSSQWGSCARNGNISLNYSLLLLPAKLRNHVILHELCHRLHMNHSGRF